MSFSWILGFTAGMVGILGHFTYIRGVSEYNYWLLVIGFLLISLSATGNRK